MPWILLFIFGVGQVTAQSSGISEVANKLANDIGNKIKQDLGDAVGLVPGSVHSSDFPIDKNEPESILKDHYNKHVKENIDSGLKIIKNVESLNEMPNNKEKLDKLVEAMPDNGKLGDIKKIYEASNKLISDSPEYKEVIKEGLSALGGSLMETLSGVVNGNWQDMLSGGLNVIGSLLMIAGPIGALISSVMSIVSGIFSLFGSGGGLTKIKESQEGMIKQVINEALEKSRAEELKSDAEGFKQEMTSVRNSINLFRDAKAEITVILAAELYNQAFIGVNFFGKLNFYINKYCESSIPSKNEKEMKESSSRCLEFLNLYSDLSILRQLLIVDVASLLGSNKATEEISKNLLQLIEKEKVTDKDLLMFFYDPINYGSKRFFISQYFGAPNKYPTIKMYLSRLSKLSEGKKDPQKVVICSEDELKGICKQFQPDTNYLGYWADKGQSLYVPDGYLVYGFITPNRKGSPYGPFTGPTVIGKLPGESDQTKWESIEISKTEFDANHFVRICAEHSLDQSGRCDMLKAGDYRDLKIAVGADESWFKKIQSMSIPEHFEVYLYTLENFGGTTYGPYYGPNTLNRLCEPKTAKSMKVLYTKTKTSGMVLICTVETDKEPAMCDYIEAKEYSSLFIKGCNWEEKIKSMRVPEGLSVTMWTKRLYNGMSFGPYTGPIFIPSVDGSKGVFINSMKIVKDPDQSSIKTAPKRR